MKGILYLLSLVYRAAVALRNALYDFKLLPIYRSKLPVISVGNITAGGNGKTPLVLLLAQRLSAEGFRPVVLSRGYGGSIYGPHHITPRDLPEMVGDEPLLIQRTACVPVVVAKKRALGAKMIEREALGDLIILDDGFQHRALARDLDIVCIDVGSEAAISEFEEGNLLPLGLFREGRAAALKRAGMIVLAVRGPKESAPLVTDSFRALLSKASPVVTSSVAVSGAFDLISGNKVQVGDCVAFCALAKPENFFRTVKSSGFRLIGQKSFPDHHKFSVEELREIRAEYPSVQLICSEKDAVKLTGEMREGVAVIKIETLIEEYELLKERIHQVVSFKRRGK